MHWSEMGGQGENRTASIKGVVICGVGVKRDGGVICGGGVTIVPLAF